MNRRRLLGLSAALLAAPAIAARAQSGPWPTRQSIRLVATFPPDGLADTIGRLVAPALGSALGQSVVIDNRAGAAAAPSARTSSPRARQTATRWSSATPRRTASRRASTRSSPTTRWPTSPTWGC